MIGSIVSSGFLVALKATGTSALKVVAIFVALKATVNRNVSSHCCQEFRSSESNSREEIQLPLLTEFGSSEKLSCQLRQLMGSIVSSRFLVVLKVTGTSALKFVRIW